MKFLGDNNKLYRAILGIIRESTQFLFIVSPYVEFQKDNTSLVALKSAIEDAIIRGVKIYLLTRGRDRLAPQKNIYRIRDFVSFPFHIYLVPFLHSKIYCNESKALVTSLNLSISSLFNENEESGVLLESKLNSESIEYKKIVSHLYSLKKRAK